MDLQPMGGSQIRFFVRSILSWKNDYFLQIMIALLFSSMALYHLVARQDRVDNLEATTLFTVSLLFTITASLSVILRLWAKRISKSKIVAEDYLCITGLAMVLVQFICVILEIQIGGIGHDFTTEETLRARQILIGCQVSYGLAVAAVKSSIVFFYVRLFGVTRGYRIAAYCLVAFIASWAIMSVLVAFISCHPFQFNWDTTILDGYCDNQVGSIIALAVFDLVADVVVFVMPLRPISKLQINNGKRLVLFLIFGLGLLTIILTILRVIYLCQLDLMAFQTTSVRSVLFSLLEPAIGISVACIPLLQPLTRNTWLGNKLVARSIHRARQACIANSNINRVHGDDNDLRLFESSSVTVSVRGDGAYDHENSEVLHASNMHGITKTECFTIGHTQV